MTRLVFVIWGCLVGLPAAAAPVDIDKLAELLRIDDTLWVLSVEGQATAATLRVDPDQRASADWDAKVAQIYDPAGMRTRLMVQLQAGLADADVTPALEFYSSDLGRRLVDAEIVTRAQISNPDTEQRMQQEAATALAENAPHVATLTQLIEDHQLVDLNVENSLNAQLALLEGMVAGGGYGETLQGQDLAALVMADADATRLNTRDWIYTFMNAAYGPFTQAELSEYSAFMASSSGKQVSTAIFAAYGTVFVQNARALGMTISQEAETQLH